MTNNLHPQNIATMAISIAKTAFMVQSPHQIVFFKKKTRSEFLQGQALFRGVKQQTDRQTKLKQRIFKRRGILF